MKETGIYLIRCKANNLHYIGQSSDIKNRWRQHKHVLIHQSKRLEKGEGLSRRANKRLVRSWKKYGQSTFDFEILEICQVENLTEREDFWIKEYKRRFKTQVANSAGPADNPMRGRKHRPETIEKIASALRGKPKPESQKKKIGDSQIGKRLSDATKEKLRKAATGRKIPSITGEKNPSCRQEQRDRMAGHKNPAKRPEIRKLFSKQRKKPVIDTEAGDFWDSASTCALELGVSVAAVSAAITRKTRCAGRTLRYVVYPPDKII